MHKWYIAIYLRLSSDDGDKFESNSIKNQKNMIKMYLEKYKDIKIFKIYIDDGYTGTDFDRPGFQDMIRDIEDGKVTAVIVKDLSRIGRNYINVGEFIEKYIKKYNLRFISINDNVDSYLKPETMTSLEVSFKNLMNENYSKDTSKKIRTSLKTSKKRGNFIGKIAPYGYVKDEKNCHLYNIDQEAADIIKKIFNMALKGKSRQEIVNELNKLYVLTPSQYMKKKFNNDFAIISNKWNLKILDYILKNENYTGRLVQNKKTRISHKTHNIVRVAEDEWIKTENHHKEIIPENIFNQVNNILYGRNSKVSKDGNYKKYSGYLKCADCGNNLYRKTRPNTKTACYYCGKYINDKSCTKHYITEIELDNLVVSAINLQINLLCELKDIINDNFSTAQANYEIEIKKIKKVEIDKKIEQYNNLLNELVNDYKEDIISQSEFEEYNKDYLYQLNNLRIEKEELENERISKKNVDWIQKVKKLEKIDNVKRNILDEFVEKIYIAEDKNIKIEFKFKEEFENILNFLNEQKLINQ